MTIVKTSPSRQVVVPKEIWDILRLNPGDYFEAIIDEGRIVLEPKKLISKDELWYWSKAGQREINKTLREIDEGKVKEFDDVEDLIKDLRA